MPTPSSNPPDPESHPSRSYPFSSCPDPDEQSLQSQPQSPSTQPQADSPSESQSSWAARGYSTDAEIEPRLNHQTDAVRSRSTTMSPGPQTDGSFDIDMRREPEGMVISQDHNDEAHKQTEEDEEMLAVETQHSTNTDSTNDGDADLVSTPTATTSRTSTHSESSRRRGKAPDSVSPQGAGELDEMEMGESTGSFPRWVEDSGLVGMGYEYMHRRIIPTSPSSYLRPGSRFTGTQQSERQRYEVQVEIKHVDMRESFLCGYLRIQGLFIFLAVQVRLKCILLIAQIKVSPTIIRPSRLTSRARSLEASMVLLRNTHHGGQPTKLTCHIGPNLRLSDRGRSWQEKADRS